MILDKKHEMHRKLFRQFAETEFTKEIQDELDETGEFNWDMHKKKMCIRDSHHSGPGRLLQRGAG